MAATNFTPISLYYSTTAAAVPTSGNLVNGELALNTADMKLYAKNSAGTVTLLASNAGASGSVTSVSGTGTVNGLTLTGTVTTSGSLTLGGTLSLVSPPPIGTTTPNVIAFTTATSTVTAQNNLILNRTDAGPALVIQTNGVNKGLIGGSGANLVFSGPNGGGGAGEIQLTTTGLAVTGAISGASNSSTATGLSLTNVQVNTGYNQILLQGSGGSNIYGVALRQSTTNTAVHGGDFDLLCADSSNVLKSRMRVVGQTGGSMTFTPDGTNTVATLSTTGLTLSGSSNTVASIIAGGLNSNNGIIQLGSSGVAYQILGGAYQGNMNLFTGAGGGPIIFTPNNAERARITLGLSVGTTSDPGTGAIYATGAITAFFSDGRLKTVSGKIENALDKVAKLSGVYYTFNDTAKSFGYDSDEEQVGVIAQEVEAVLPQVVKAAPFDLDEHNNSKSGQNYKTVQYEKLVPLLIEAINELRAEVTALKGTI